jgi:hypothetical protein
MNINDFQTEEKVRLDPKCWTGKKIGNPKTKVKGGVRVNNCVPAESVNEADKGIPHRVRYQYDDPSGSGIASGHITLHAPDKAAAARYATSDLSKKGKKNVKVLAVSAQKPVAEAGVVGDTEQDQELRNYSQDTADMAKQEIKNKMFNTLPTPGEDDKVHEEYNAEYDDEAGMADNNLGTLRKAVDGIDQLISRGDNLPEWCQEKIAVAENMLVNVWDYMQGEQDSEEEDPEIAEMYEAMEELAEAMARRNRVSVDRVWESFEALDDHMLYETAAWRRKEGKSKTGGLNAKGVASYRRENPGSKLQTAVTTKPSKLKKGSKAAKRRKSFCARMSGVKGPMKKPNGKPTRKALALRKWNC